jgi:hypothetical protein
MLNFYKYHNGQLDERDKYANIITDIRGISACHHSPIDYEPIMHIIRSNINLSVNYAKYVLRNRWLEFESMILENTSTSEIEKSSLALSYAREVIRDRWVEIEPMIMNYPHHAVWYATDVIHGRWLEAEPTIKKYDYWWSYYCQELDI